MSDLDLTQKAIFGYDRAEKLGLQAGEWRTRIRESGAPETTGKETVETLEWVQDPVELAGQWQEVIARQGEAGQAVWVHIEMIQTGAKSPFFSFTVQLRDPTIDIEPTEGGAMAALAQMGIRSNKLLYDLALQLSAKLLSARQAEMAMAVTLAEASGRAEAGDDTAKWEAAARVASELGPGILKAMEAASEAAAAAKEAAEERRRAEEERRQAEAESSES